MFARFWERYPRKVGKPKAAVAFAKHKPTEELLKTILDALDFWSRSEKWTSDGGKYITYPEKWINNRGWEDEPPRVLFSQVGNKIESPEERTARLAREARRDSGMDDD